MRPAISFAPAAIVLLAAACFGQGVITPRRHQPAAPQGQTEAAAEVKQPMETLLPAALPVSSIKITPRIDGQIATIKVEHSFRNDSDETLEGTYYFPVPEGASLIEFAVYEGDERRVGRIKDKEEARAAYSAGLAQGEDPAVLEMAKNGWFQSHVYPIAPHSEKRIEIEYSQLLQAKDGVITFDYPLGKGYRKLRVPVGNVSINLDLRSDTAIKNVFSPTHPMEINYDGDRHVTGRIGTVGGEDAENFQLIYSLSNEELGMSLLTYRKKGEDGYFLLMLSPRVEFDERRISAKDVVFAIDVSGSMKGAKMEQAKAALKSGLTGTLKESDRFNIIAFQSFLTPMSPEMLPATRANVQSALKFVDGLEANGGTNINDSLVAALKMFARGGRPQNLVFITDGVPTASVTNPDEIVSNARSANAAGARLFTFGVGGDVNRILLERLALENRGAESNIANQSELEATVSSFFAKVSRPVLSNLQVDFGPLFSDRIQPAQLPDLYTRSQIRIFGRYRNSEDLRNITVALTGQMNENPQRFEFSGLNFPLVTEDKQFLPKLWATERVNALLAEIRVHGETLGLKQEVLDLAREFNLVTPYTSMYVPTTGELASEKAGQVQANSKDAPFEKLQLLADLQRPPASARSSGRSDVGIGSGTGKGVTTTSQDVLVRSADASIGNPAAPALSRPVNGRDFSDLAKVSPGTIVDQNGAVIAGATVTLKDQNTGATRTVTTDQSGNYTVAGLPPGNYKVDVAAAGFKNATISNVVVQPGQIAATGVALSVGAASEEVTVTSVAPAVDTQLANSTSDVESRRLRDLPSLEPVDSFSRLAPGVDARKPDGAAKSRDVNKDAESQFRINGGSFRSNNYSFNGHDNNDIDGRPAVSISIFDALDTLHVVTTRGSGDVGATGAASINLLSRGGTNEFHGTAFEYYLNRKFGALSPLERRSGLNAAPVFRSDLFGGTLGGPVIRDRMFFFGTFQGEREDSSRFSDSTSSFLTPTSRALEELSRFFSDSATVADLVARGPLSRRLGNPAVLRSITIPAIASLEFGEITRIIPTSARGYEAGGRFDFNVTSRDSLKASYWYDSRGATNAVGRLAAGYPGDTGKRAQLGGIYWNRTLSPRATSELGVSFNRARLSLDSTGENGPAVNIGPRDLAYGPSPLLPAQHNSTLYAVSETFSYVAGRHNLKLGAQVRHRATDFDYLPGAAGNFTYANFEDFVLDRPAALVVAAGNRFSSFGETQQHYFIDDAWRVRSNLTFTMGLGYENGGQPINGLADGIRQRESNGATALFDSSIPIEMRTIANVGRDNNNFTPRAGFAYTPRFRFGGLNLFGYDRTVIRGGATVSYDQTAYRPLADVAASSPNIMLAVITPGSVMLNFPSLPSSLELRSLFQSDPASFARTELARDFRTPFSTTWHLAISRELRDRTTAEVAYVGSRGVGLIRSVDATVTGSGPTRVYESTGRSTYHSLQARFDVRLAETLTGGVAYTLSKSIDDVPGGGGQVVGGIGSAASLTLGELQQFAQSPFDVSRGERALSDLDRRHTMVAHFVWSLPFKRARNGISERLLTGWQASGIVEMAGGSPFTPLQYLGASPASAATFASIFSDRLGAVRPFAGNPAAPMDAVAFSNAANKAFGFFRNVNGTPFISPTGFIVASSSGFRAGSLQDARLIYNDYAVEQRARAMGLAADAFGQTYAAGRQFGDAGRNSLIGPSLANIDFALVKTTKLSEKIQLQFRAEAFNLFNHPNRGKPNSVLENAGGFGFGDLGEVDSTPRRVRFALKLIF